MEKNSMNTSLLNIETLCPICGKYSTVLVRKEDYIAWNKGILLVQEAFPYLPAEDREKLISGICPDCWNKMFSTEKWWAEEDEEEEEEEEEEEDCITFDTLEELLKLLKERGC